MIRRKNKPIDLKGIEKRNLFFEKIWNSRPHKCEVTGVNLGREPNSMYFHHILPKRNYPEFEFNEDNIVLLHPDVHASVEMDMYKYPEINDMRLALKINYGL